MGILEEICLHMIKQSFSIPQLILKDILTNLIGEVPLYNTRKIIKPYELDVYFDSHKIGFEYNGKGWHLSDNINKFEICKNNGIYLFTLVENNRKYEKDIKFQLINFLPEINQKFGKNISKDNIINYKITNNIYQGTYSEKSIVEICSQYDDFSKFRKDNTKLYHKLYKMNMLSKYTSHMKKRIIWSDELAIQNIKQYSYLKDLLRSDYGCYIWVKKNKKEYLLANLIKGHTKGNQSSSNSSL
jgi:hypothetical protein